ncbi:MAG: glycosyltransferase family 1 protein, partial [Nostoc sp.]
ESQELAQVIITCLQETEITATIANNARTAACERFDVAIINQQIAQLLSHRF